MDDQQYSGENSGQTGGQSEGGQGGFQRQMHQGNWECSGCGNEITELPFEPDGQRPIFCRDCYRNRKQSR